MSLYNTSALYNQNMSESKQAQFRDFYLKVFSSYDVKAIHDCTIGAGGTTLPLARLGYIVSGSDLSRNLVERAKENFSKSGYAANIFVLDLREIDMLEGKYDCIMSTGNSIAHVTNDDIQIFIEKAVEKLNPGGLLYLDTRNWDKLLSEKPVFKARDPLIMNESEHVSLYQVFNWHDDNSVDFIFITSKDENKKHIKTSYTYAPTYYPIKLATLQKLLKDNGLSTIKLFNMDDLWLNKDDNKNLKISDDNFLQVEWYGLLAQLN
jgi:2-polyprenyl-3-methyl-5-hydroxy-6-metoxy-1,4-benzoquinol methylase